MILEMLIVNQLLVWCQLVNAYHMQMLKVFKMNVETTPVPG
jgi:hypothetical protein